MNGAYHSLVNVLSARGIDWLQQQITDIDDPQGLDPDALTAMAEVGQVAAVLTGLRGRPSSLQIVASWCLTAPLIRDAAARVLAGDTDRPWPELVLAGRTICHDDPRWQLACQHLSEAMDQPLYLRLALGDATDLPQMAEQALTAPLPADPDPDYCRFYADLLMRFYEFGAIQPRLQHAANVGQMLQSCQRLAQMAVERACTLSLARMIFCIGLVDPGHDVAPLLAHLMNAQRPDGSFAAALQDDGDAPDLHIAIGATLWSCAALHLANLGGWRGQPQPRIVAPDLHQIRRLAVAGIVDRLHMPITTAPPGLRLRAAVSLTRATGQNWLSRINDLPSRISAPEQARLGVIAFPDGVTAWALRRAVTLTPPVGEMSREQAWLHGRAVRLPSRMSRQLLDRWRAAAARDDRAGAFDCARAAVGCADAPDDAAIRAQTRRMMDESLHICGTTTDLAVALDHLDRLTVLADLFGDRRVPADA
ncbi:hypothetical protein [Paracoccus sp. (in: a-proteobacteria)]|uniref:hypothetical protein n=1 Tax=Paracoccus sp. TaxID=267 RepID=UPI0026E0CE21|nr:hypothetical protein [Paracoccus sp. (in: a-proteobacteria)]MDO5647927.1 hypothetical protein [Paracoccus sp. (in: a-proteobacteria)]